MNLRFTVNDGRSGRVNRRLLLADERLTKAIYYANIHRDLSMFSEQLAQQKCSDLERDTITIMQSVLPIQVPLYELHLGHLSNAYRQIEDRLSPKQNWSANYHLKYELPVILQHEYLIDVAMERSTIISRRIRWIVTMISIVIIALVAWHSYERANDVSSEETYEDTSSEEMEEESEDTSSEETYEDTSSEEIDATSEELEGETTNLAESAPSLPDAAQLTDSVTTFMGSFRTNYEAALNTRQPELIRQFVNDDMYTELVAFIEESDQDGGQYTFQNLEVQAVSQDEETGEITATTSEQFEYEDGQRRKWVT